MNHEISDALTGAEARTVCACLCTAVAAHDATGDTIKLVSDLLATVELAYELAYSSTPVLA